MGAKAPPKTLFGYDLEMGVLSVNAYLANLGMDPIEDGDEPLAVWRAKRGLLPGQTPTADPDPAVSGGTTNDPA